MLLGAETMEETVVGLISMIVGFLMVVFHKRFGRLTVEFQNRFWGFHFGDREARASGIIAIIVGAWFIIVGFLAFMKIIHFR